MNIQNFLIKLFHMKLPVQKVIEKQYIQYEPLGEIQSENVCKYVLNKLIAELERQKEEFGRTSAYLDLNDRNSGQILGSAAQTNNVLLMVKQYLEDYWNKSVKEE